MSNVFIYRVNEIEIYYKCLYKNIKIIVNKKEDTRIDDINRLLQEVNKNYINKLLNDIIIDTTLEICDKILLCDKLERTLKIKYI